MSLTWDELYGNTNIGFSQLSNYVIYWDEGTLPALTTKINVTGLSHVIDSGIIVNSTYKFQIAAENLYGEGIKSAVVTKLARSTIGKLDPVQITQDASPNIQNVNFDWSLPVSDNGSPVIDFKLLIMNGQTGIYMNNETLCNGTSATVISNSLCTITMTNLRLHYSYSLGSII